MTETNAPTRGGMWRWFWGFLFLFLAHVAAVFWISEREKPSVQPEQTKPLLYIASDEATERRFAEMSVLDPTLLALPSERGFSGDAWLKFAPRNMTVSNWVAPAAWLPLDAGELGTTLARYGETNRVPVDALLDGPHTTTPFELRRPSTAIASVSTFTLHDLSSRRLVRSAPLLVATNADLITNSVVEIWVNGDGVVESAVLVGPSGLKQMDEHAVAAAKELAFAPLPLSRATREATVPQRGRVVFTWSVVPQPLTNGLTLNSP